MDVLPLVEMLAASDERQREAAADGLVAAGERAVLPLIAAIYTALEPDSMGMRISPYEQVFARLGEVAFGPVIEVLSKATEWHVVRAAGIALKALAVDPAFYVQTLGHHSANVRERTLCVFQAMGSEALPYTAEIVPLVVDSDEDVRNRALHIIGKIGADGVPALRRLRREPGHLRRAALASLFQVGGWNAVEPADQALVRRLIGIKLRDEVPCPLYTCGAWFAVPTSDQASVLDAFDLSDAMPVTMRLGAAVAQYGEDRRWAYVTPAFNGWTLVYTVAEDEGAPAVLVELSRRFGSAQFYGDYHDVKGWSLAQHGTVIRHFSEEYAIGRPLPFEVEYALAGADKLRDSQYEDDRETYDLLLAEFVDIVRSAGSWDPGHKQPDQDTIDDSINQILSFVCDLSEIAEKLSINPATLGPGTPVQGHGVLALTELGRRHGPPPGIFPI